MSDCCRSTSATRGRGARCQVLTQAIMRRQWTGKPPNGTVQYRTGDGERDDDQWLMTVEGQELWRIP